MRVFLAAWRELARDYNRLPEVLYAFEHKMYFILIHVTYNRIDLPLKYFQEFRGVKFVTIPPCFYSNNICKILLYNRRLIFITYEVIYVVRAAHC